MVLASLYWFVHFCCSSNQKKMKIQYEIANTLPFWEWEKKCDPFTDSENNDDEKDMLFIAVIYCYSSFYYFAMIFYVIYMKWNTNLKHLNLWGTKKNKIQNQIDTNQTNDCCMVKCSIFFRANRKSHEIMCELLRWDKNDFNSLCVLCLCGYSHKS